MKNNVKKATCWLLAIGLIACDQGVSNSADATTDKLLTAPVLKSGVELSHLNTQVKPQQDFFQYVNGNWLQKTAIPADRARWGSFDELRENSEKRVLQLVQETAAKPAAAGTEQQKIGDLYRSFLDVQTINQRALTPLNKDFAAITALTSYQQLATLWGQLQHRRYGSPLLIAVSPDQKNSSQYTVSISQAGLGLPDREYYLKTDEKSQQITKQYQWMIARYWELAGWSDGSAAAESIYYIESQLAQLQWSRVQNRDRNATYNKMTLAELTTTVPDFSWVTWLQGADLTTADQFVVRQPTYLQAFGKLVAQIPLADWQLYLKFHTLRSHAAWLSADFAQTDFDFYGRVLNGLQEQKTREKRAVAAIEDALGFSVGKLYVEHYFSATAKARMDQMIGNLKQAFDQSIRELDWMSEATKTQALAKLKQLNTKIGYPEVWRDYSCLQITADDLVGNMQRAAACDYQRMIARLGKPVDRSEWGMTPQTVNAYYSATMNEIVFPAAILQPPFFNVEADDAVNYGAIGAVIGHEISHGFDDQGRQSDGEGNLRDWWTAVDAAQFKQRAQLMVDQYSAFNPIDDLKLQGALGLGENIADLGGLTVAYRAFHNSLKGQPATTIDGFTGDKRFFIGWAQIWRIKFRDEALRQQIITGPHSPGMYRVLGTLANMPEFYQTYQVQPGDGMYRPEQQRVKIW